MPQLQAQLGRLREIFAKDRAENVPGVWLPLNVAHKYRNAGVQWQWPWVFQHRSALVRTTVCNHSHLGPFYVCSMPTRASVLVLVLVLVRQSFEASGALLR
jgi:hypothetical protein